VARIAAVSLVALTNVVTRGLPFHRTVAPLTKLLPFAVRVSAPEPALTVFGVSEFSTGTGLLTVNVTAFDVPPPGAGLVTVTGTAPGVATSVARTAAVSEVALTNVVTLGAPLKFTTDVETKPVPVTVRVKPAEPAITVVGDTEVAVGRGLGAALILKFIAAEVPPPGVGFVTVTGGLLMVVISVARIAAVS
jgi:hypothetical protein